MTELLTRPAPGPARPESFDEALTCTQVIDVTHDVKTFVLAPQGLVKPVYDPGQYLTLTVDVDGERLQRCYTISASPTRPGPLEITVKRVPGGPVSTWLHDHLAPGDTIWANGPHGEFSYVHHPADQYLFLSAGSGVTPLMSMTRTLYDAGPADIVFVHSARTPDDIVFRAELGQMADRGDLTVTAICEADSPTQHWAGRRGRLDLRTLLMVPDLHDREIFTCGPQGYMAAVRDTLEQAGVDPDRCHEESYDLAARAATRDTDDGEVPTGRRYAVELRRSGRVLDCGEDETLLHAAHRAGLNPPSMCTEGMCGTCKMALLCGQVDMQHAGGIRQREIDAGEILICCSTPLGDVTLDA